MILQNSLSNKTFIVDLSLSLYNADDSASTNRNFPPASLDYEEGSTHVIPSNDTSSLVVDELVVVLCLRNVCMFITETCYRATFLPPLRWSVEGDPSS